MQAGGGRAGHDGQFVQSNVGAIDRSLTAAAAAADSQTCRN